MVFVSAPAVALPEHEVTTDEICADVVRRMPDLPKLPAVLRIMRSTGVQTRRFCRPLEVATSTRPIGQRVGDAFAGLATLAERAAMGALAAADLTVRDVDAVVTSHSTGWSVPGLDVHLVNALSLRPEVARIALSQLGCAGGAQALSAAMTHARAHPDRVVLVVCAEAISSVYHHGDASVEAMIYKALFGDGAAACLVSSRPLTAGLRLSRALEYTLPGSAHFYRQRLDERGQHFDSSPEALQAVSQVAPVVRRWLDAPGKSGPLEFAVIHPGGPKILEAAAEGLGIPQDFLKFSWAALAEHGNLGGPSVLSVLARCHDAPPPSGARGVLWGFGPGFVTAAVEATWITAVAA